MKNRHTIIAASAGIMISLAGILVYLRVPFLPSIIVLPGNPPVTISDNRDIQVGRDWRTYFNAINNYSVAIPPDWLIDDQKGVFIGVPGEVILIPPEQQTVELGQTSVRISAVPEDQVTRYPLRYPLYTAYQFEDWFKKSTPTSTGQRVYKIGTTTVDRLPAIQYVVRTLPDDATEPFYAVITWFRYDGSNYNIEFGGADENEVHSKMTTYLIILSTFKFTQ